MTAKRFGTGALVIGLAAILIVAGIEAFTIESLRPRGSPRASTPDGPLEILASAGARLAAVFVGLTALSLTGPGLSIL